MNCTKHSLLSALLGLMVLLTACSSNTPKPAEKKSAASETIAAPGASILPPGPATANPYLQNKPALERDAVQLFNAATFSMRNKQWAQAEAQLQKIIATQPKLSGAHLNLGLVYRQQQEHKRAEQAFTDAIAANHTNLDAYNQLAILQREAGNFSAAEANYKKALSVWPFHADSHKNIAILYDLYLGKSAEALPHYEAYLQLRGGDDKQVKSWIVDLQRRLGINTKAKAEAAAAIGAVNPETPAAGESNE